MDECAMHCLFGGMKMKHLNKKLISVFLAVILVISVLPFSASTAMADTDLATAKANYVAKITDMKNNGTVYTNTIYAYLKYIAACADGAGAAEANDLQAAVNAMTVFVPKTGNESVSINGSTTSGYYSNVLWSENPTALQYSNLSHGYIYWSNGILQYGGDIFIYQPSAVLLYDGTTEAKIPVIFAEQENEGRYRFRYGYVTETDGRLKSDWVGYSTAPRDGTSTAVNVVWPTSSSYTICGDAVGYENTYFDANTEHDSKCDFYNFKNSLVFNPGESLYKKYSSFEWDIHAYWWNTVTSREHVSEGANTLTTNNAVYVLNYKKLLDAIDAMLARFSGDESLLDPTTAQFASGNSANVFGALDKATSLELSDSKYDYGVRFDDAVRDAYTDLNSAIKDLESANSSEGTVSTLASYIVKYEQNMKENPFRSDLEDTYKLYLKAKECFDAYMFGQNKTQTFLDRVSEVASAFQTAVDNQVEFATKNNDGTYTANVYTGEYTPDSGEKFFAEDDVSGTNAYNYYNGDSIAAAKNILYYPQVELNSPVLDWNQYGDIVENASETSRCMFKLYYPNNLVLLYNGANNAKFPIMVTATNTSGWSDPDAWFRWMYPTTHAVQGVYRTGSNFSSFSSYLYGDSTEFGIRQYTVYRSSSNDYGVPYGWQGGARNDSTRAPLNWNLAWTQNTTTYNNNVGNIAGRSDANNNDGDYGRMRINKNQGNNYTLGAASVLEYKDTWFANHSDEVLKTYESMNWNIMWSEEPTFQYYGRSLVQTAYADINVINTIPVTNAIQSLVGNSDVKDILNYVYLYDGDAADYIELLRKIDAIGDFNPNENYDFSDITGGSGTYSANKGVDDCVTDIYNIIEEVSEVSDVISDEPGEGVVVPPTAEEKLKESSSTETDNPDLESWYGDLRNALMNPEEADECSDDDAWAAYETALTNARDAITAAAMSDSVFYPATYNGKTISDYAEELNEAKAAFIAAPGKHTFLYENEDENQISDWSCTHSEIHSHGSADMSAYNELDIAYNTIDREAYKNFDELLGSTYDDGNYNDDATDPDNISFVEVKKRATQKGEAPQDFVDKGIARLLEAINEAAQQEQGQESHLNTYRVSFIVKIDGEEPSTVIDNEEYAYNTTPTFDATEAPPYKIYGASCYKWTVKIGDGEEVSIRNNTSSLAYTVRSNCTVTAYATKAPSADQIKVKIAGATSAFQYGMNVAKDTPITFGEADENGDITITVGTTTYTIKATSAYKNVGWTIGYYGSDVAYSGSIEDYTAGKLAASLGRSELCIYPMTDLRATGSYRIQLLGETEGTISSIAKADDTVSLGEEVGGVMTLSGVKYDDLVTATFTPDASKGTFYAMVINEAEMAGGTVPRYVPISYSNTYTFYANSYMNFYPLYVKNVTVDGITTKVYYVDDGNETRITDATDLYHLQHYIPFVINLMDTQNVPGKHIFRTIYTANIPASAGVKVTEHGRVYFSTTNQTVAEGLAIGESDCVIGNKWTFDGHEYSITKKVASGSVNKISNQYAYNSTNPSSGYKFVISRGYIKYEYPFSQTVIENGVEVTYTATIEGIEYGRADTYTYPSN